MNDAGDALAPVETGYDAGGEVSLRPSRLEEYVGQREVTENLDISIRAARARGDALDHVLLIGPPGLGKTSLAHILAAEVDAHIHQTSGPVIDKGGDLAAILTSLERNDVLFIDEIHRLGKTVEEILYPAMEDFRIDLVVGEGASARSINIDVEPFTLVGATTRSGLLTAPLRSRFGSTFRLDFYDHADLSAIVGRSADLLRVELEEEAAFDIARRSRGTPRIANRLLRRLRDYAEVRAAGRITHEVVRDGLSVMGVDEAGFDSMDRLLVTTIIEKFDGGPVGVETLSAAVGEDSGTLEEVYEPYLIREGFLQRTARGRVATLRAYEHLGVTPNAAQADLFE